MFQRKCFNRFQQLTVIWLFIVFTEIAVRESKISVHPQEYKTFLNREQQEEQTLQHSNQVEKSKVDVLGSVLKSRVESLRKTPNKQVELVFLVDSSASVGAENFFNELKFVKKLLADFTVEYNATRVAVITFSSRNRVVKHVDHVSNPSFQNHKCSLLDEQLPTITYQGGGTYTLGAVLQAQEVLEKARPNARKAIFLVTDGYSNGGDPRPAAKMLQEQNVEIFTFGIQNGNVRELFDMASHPAEEHSYILGSFEEFEALARRALHEDLHIGSYLKQNSEACRKLCNHGSNCCDSNAECTCGTHTGHYACLCNKGYYGTGLQGDCYPCPAGTYKPSSSPGDLSSCMPCPDVNQESHPASTSLEHCRCKTGFQKILNKCVALQCPELSPPEHGYFVNDDCSNVFNAACGIRCEAGYKLVGSSIRICVENKTWTGEESFCKMKTCPALSPPRHGTLNCTTGDHVFETECYFNCESGYYLVGSKKRTCLAISLWDGLPALCRPVMCPVLKPLQNGKLSPAQCIKAKSSFGDKCFYECNEGFKLLGPEQRQCVDPGVWSEENNSSVCLDIEAPVIDCPEDVVVNTDENEASALVRWSEPFTSDNSNDLVVVTVIPAIVSPRRFDIGTASVLYTARDKGGNKAQCNFTVTVRDIQPPTMDRCRSPSTFLSRVLPVEVSWEEPIFSDNSGHEIIITRSHPNPGLFPLGSTKVIYEAKDEAGNNNTCIITITVQEHACAFPSDPVHGRANCTEAENGVFCSLSCSEGYGFALKIPPFYFCAYDGIWKPVEFLPFPDCSFMFFANSISKFGTVSVMSNGLSCEDNFLLGQLEKHLERKISNRVSRICHNNIICEVENMIAECETDAEIAEEATNMISYRRKRQVPQYSVLPGHMIESHFIPNSRIYSPFMSNATSYNSEEEFSDRTFYADTDEFQDSKDSKDLLASEKLLERYSPNKIELEFQLTGKLPQNSDELAEQKALMENIQTAMSTLEDAAHKGELDVSLGNKRLHVQYVKFDRGDLLYVCEAGTVAQGNICVKCPIGTYFNVVSETCEACPLGTYQFLEGQFSCLVCPDRTSTTTGQSKSLGECKAQCLPGTFSSTGLEPCETCAVGFYQSNYSQIECLPCPHSKTTHRRGVRSITECKVPCPPGEVSRIGLQPCFPCPDGFFQPHEGSKSCFRCPNSQRTGMQGAKNISACQGVSPAAIKKVMPESAELTINDCFSVPCMHGATCKALDIGFLCICVPGYVGIYCEEEVNECESNPCVNGGTCKDHVNGYTCFCPVGYSGERCEVNINDCFHDPCFNGATCFDKINGYHCSCSAGYVGPLCQYNIDECLSNPCRNGGFCVDLVANYICDCMPGFEGRNCEINIDDCVSQPCNNNATCVDDILHFRCECITGYEGLTCEVDINECQPDPCMNGATCIDKIAGFKCFCLPSYTGDLCETELSSDFILHFPNSGILDFVELETLPRPLTAVTVCMWMETKDKLNYGTPISYAADNGADNLLTLTDYSGFVFYVNMQKVVTDVTVNDGQWHHICVTWSSFNGSWNLYKNGSKEDGGFGLAIGTIIPATGILVLGQEQDGRGTGFSTAESYIGSITLLNMWDYVLDQATIASFSTRCDKYKGNVKSWADFRAGIRGKVELTDSHFCNGCNNPEPFSYGDVTVTGVKTQAIATYICDSGYEIKGALSRRCLSSGYWSDMPPKCVRINCGFPGYIANGYINGRQYFYQDVIQYVCNPGYRLLGESTRTCQFNHKWSGNTPYCEEILCETPSSIANGKVIAFQNKYQLGHRIQFTCNDGYKLYGPSFLTCSSDGQWNDTLPICQPRSCEYPPRVPHGSINGPQSNFDVGSLIQYVCEAGFEMVGTDEILCELKNRWVGDLPKCERITCDHPPYILHATIDGKDYKYGDTIKYICEPGYDLIGTSVSTCKADGTWSDTRPHCQPINCHGLEAPDHGWIEVPELTYGSVAKYSCHTGYELQGVRSRKCRTSGEWSGECPMCVPVSCSQPESISNGRYIGSDWTVGNTVTYSCNPGYTLFGEADSVCLETGHWFHNVPSCEPVECPFPDPIINGSIQFIDRKFGHKAIYYCDLGFQLIGLGTRVCMENQKWEPGVPECQPVSCGEPPNIENGFVTRTSSIYEGIASYTCRVGFYLEGSSVQSCTANGKWSDGAPVCNIIQCVEPVAVPHAYLINSDTRFGSVVEYYCDEGYKLIGRVQRSCNANGSWDGSQPECVRVRCPLPPPLLNGEVYTNDTFYNSIATYSCHHGYEIKGPVTRICLQEEVWSGPDPSCIAIRCPKHLLELNNGKIIGDNNVMGATIQFECDIGYYLVGENTKTCQENKTWSGFSPYCEIVQCPIPKELPYSKITWTGHSFKDTIAFSCLDGYVLVGESLRSCSPDGSWSGMDPQCNPVECAMLSNPEHGKVIIDSLLFKSHAKYECDYGYKLIGTETRYCKADRTWSNKEPECALIICPAPPTTAFGHHIEIKKEYTVSTKADYKCNEGFIMEKVKAPIVCNIHGKWSGPLPVCKIVQCQTPPSLLYGYVEGNNFTFGNIIYFTCSIGWKLIGANSATCQSDGQWSSPFPTCEGTKCPLPEHLEHGFVSSTDFNFRSVIRYNCIKGYELVGNIELKCENNNQWSGSLPKCLPVTCNTPQHISHATFIGDMFEYGSTVTYICDVGYELHGAKQLTCSENKTWNYDPPVCEQISCPLPDPLIYGEVIVYSYSQGAAGRDLQIWPLLIPRGDITIDGKTALDTSRSDIFHWNDKVTYRCSPGYKLFGASTRCCQDNGTWSDVVPKCEPVKCNAPENLLLGDVSVNSLHFKSQANYSCESGYKIIGPSKRECQANATWSFGLPSCVPIVCPVIQNIPHGYVKWTSLRYGASATYECLSGYKLIGKSMRICNEDGKWSKEEPSCISRECQMPAAPKNGWVEAKNIIVGSTATYHCNDGYELHGTFTRTCLTNETWSLMTPKCKVVSCILPLNIEHGYVNGTDFTFGSVIEYQCNVGYRLEGNAYLTCLSNKMWSKDVPKCKPLPCLRPVPPSHGTILFRNLTVGSTVHFSCKEGYQVQEPTSITCLPNQTWTSSPPACKIITCPMPRVPKNGKILNLNITYGTKIKFICLEKYKLEGAVTSVCTGNGTWSEPSPKCGRYLCDEILRPSNSTVTVGPYVVGQIVTYYCNVGYTMEGNRTMQCNSSGHWQGSPPFCHPADCGIPPLIKHASISVDGKHTFGGFVKYSCEFGYELKDEIVTCAANGLWVGNPKCDVINCDDPPKVNHTTVLVYKKPGITEAIYTCGKGFRLLGVGKHVCLGNSSWNVSGTTCEKIKCGEPSSIAFGDPKGGSGMSVGSRISYQCHPGFRIVGNFIIECSWQGIWEGNPPHCVPISCPPPEALEHGIVEGDDFSFQNAILYSCDKGYQIFGRDNRFCLEDGSWSGEKPICRRISCGEVNTPENGFILEDKTGHYGDIVHFACHNGFEIMGADHLRCLHSGKWDNPPPICIAASCEPPMEFPPYTVLIDFKQKKFHVGDKITFFCEPGFRQYGKLFIQCSSNKTWKQPHGLCKKISCGKPKINNGAIVLGMSYYYKDNLIVVCPPGTKNRGKTILSCKGDGEWDTNPSCEGLCHRPCLNGGICVPPGLCSCPSGFVGDVCQHAVCILPCLNGGTCVGPYKCLCLPGFSGSRCQIGGRRYRPYKG